MHNEGNGTKKFSSLSRRNFLMQAGLIGTGGLLATAGWPMRPAAAAAYPEAGRTLTIVEPWAAGGSTDISLRLLVPGLEAELGIPVLVVNKPGGGTQVGLTEIALARPDGYTIGMVNMPTTALTYLDPDRQAAYNRQSFEPIANLGSSIGSIGVRTGGKFKTLQEFIDAAKANPGQLKVATSGLMTNTHIDILAFQRVTDTRFSLVHFDGAAQSITAVLGDHVDAMVSSFGNYAAQVKAGEMQILGIMSDKQSAFAPGAPTMEEQGYQVYGYSTRSLAAPAGVSPEIITILSTAVGKVLAMPDVVAKLDEMSLGADYMDAQQFGAYWDELDVDLVEAVRLAKEV